MQGTFREFEPYNLSDVLVTDRALGKGSYGAVVEIEFRGLKCAGKKIHQALSLQGDTYSLRRFAEECRLLSQTRHPNVVQFLGVHFEGQVAIPILVMEFLPTNLSSCIDEYGILPKEINYSILHDVSLGLNYLHSQSPPIIHRDLSANNVLLTFNMTAKISDLGVARIFNLTPLQMSRMTETPGTPSYMPPEVMVADPKYDTSVDVFSYGIMMIHVFSGKWPHPNSVQVCVGSDGQLIPVSEAERREEYLRNIGHDHLLMDLILKCISNDPPQRGTASEIVQRLKDAVVHFPPSFVYKLEMLTQIEALGEEKRGLVAENAQKCEKIEHEQKRVKEMEEEHRRRVEHLEIVTSTEIELLRSEVRDVNAQVEMITSEKQTIESEKELFSKTIETERQTFREANKAQKSVFEKAIETKREIYKESIESLKIFFEEEKEALQQSIEEEKEAHRKTVESHRKIQETHAIDIRMLQSKFDAIKLESVSENANLTVENSQMKAALASKEQELATMTISLTRKDSEIASKKTALAQKDDRIKSLNHQVMRVRGYLLSKTQPMQAKITWKQCTDLPIPASYRQTTVINNKVYYGGFITIKDEDEFTVCCYDPSQDTWSTLPPLPVRWFGLGQVRGQLVAVGGARNSDGEISNKIYAIDDRLRKWKQPFPSMPTARHSPAVLSRLSTLIVAGGSSIYDYIDAIEIFNTDTLKWHRMYPLPIPCRDMSSVIVNDMYYLVGGYKYPSRLNQVLCVSVDEFLVNATPINEAAPSPGTDETQGNVITWKLLADIPTYGSTVAVIGEAIISIGGNDDHELGKSQSAVYMYSPSTDSWIYISDLPAPRVGAATAVLSSTEVLVIGGLDNKCQKKTVYKGTLNVS